MMKVLEERLTKQGLVTEPVNTKVISYVCDAFASVLFYTGYMQGFLSKQKTLH